MGLLGGLGLFLLGMHLMTDGLRVSAGNALRNILAASTRTRMRGVLSGTFITSLVQSSGAVTMASIGFVNAGLLTLAESVAITYGSNLGTTSTAWLVSTIGFHVNIKLFAMPAIGIGMFLKVFSRKARLAAVGEAMAGFGVFFLGIDLLRDGFTGLHEQVDLAAVSGPGLAKLVMFVGIGILMTVLAQSSSASVAITLTATGSGILMLQDAAAMVIGANIGTTSTALLAAIGATPNARRMATAHILFNVVTGVAALLLLPLLLPLIQLLQGEMHLGSGPVIFLALFHTSFNLLGIALMWPFTDRMVTWLQGRFRAAEEDDARPKYLDRTLVSAPVLALEALRHELRNMLGLTARMCKGVLSSEVRTPLQLEQDTNNITQLADAVGDYAGEMRRSELPDAVAGVLPLAIGISRYCSDNAELAMMVNRREGVFVPGDVREPLNEFRLLAVSLIDAALLTADSEQGGATANDRVDMDMRYQKLKRRMLHAGTLGEVPVRQVIELVELAKDIERIAKQTGKAADGLSAMRAVAENRPEAGAAVVEAGNPVEAGSLVQPDGQGDAAGHVGGQDVLRSTGTHAIDAIVGSGSNKGEA